MHIGPIVVSKIETTTCHTLCFPFVIKSMSPVPLIECRSLLGWPRWHGVSGRSGRMVVRGRVVRHSCRVELAAYA